MSDITLAPGWLARAVKRAAYKVAAEARDAARKRFEEAQRAMWNAEHDWDEAEKRVQLAFVEMASTNEG